jgi:hypothetical protein
MRAAAPWFGHMRLAARRPLANSQLAHWSPGATAQRLRAPVGRTLDLDSHVAPDRQHDAA